MPANSGYGKSLPPPTQWNTGDIFILQTAAGDLPFLHIGAMGWQQLALVSSPTLTNPTLTNPTLTTPTITGRITAASVGASGKSLMNFVPAVESSNAYPRTTLSGTGTTSAVPFTVTGLPSSAVAALVEVSWNPGAGKAVGDQVQFLTASTDLHPVMVITLSQLVMGQTANGVLPCTPGASNQLCYYIPVVTGGNPWSVTVDLLGWYEAT